MIRSPTSNPTDYGRPTGGASSLSAGFSTALGPSSPPTLPIVRQPSPLSFSMTSESHSPPRSPSTLSNSSLPIPEIVTGPIAGPSRTRRIPSPTNVSPPHRDPGRDGGPVPISPLPDSILYRSTLAQLESSSSALKRMSKSVLAHSSVLIAALEAVEKAEEEFLVVLGELGRYLEGGFGVSGGIWAEDGVRKLRKDRWQGQRDEVRGMVEQGVASVKGDLKRWGLAGGGGQARFERTSKQYYDQTSTYLSHSDPSSSSAPAAHSMSATSTPSTHSRQSSPTAAETEQSARTASFELARYCHHSTLLYAVPPSSLSCLDLLVNIYGWVGGVLGENPVRRESLGGMEEAYESTPSLVPQPLKITAGSSSIQLKDEVASTLSRLAGVRVELLDGWAQRNQQTAKLEDEVNRLLTLSESKGSSSKLSEKPLSPIVANTSHVTTISNTGVEFKKHGGRMHKLHKSVGGRLRDLLSSSASGKDLAGIAGRNGGEKSSRNSFDISELRGGRRQIIRELAEIEDEDEVEISEDRRGSGGSTMKAVSGSDDAVGGRLRPGSNNRHSIQVLPDSTPFLVDPDLFPLPLISSDASHRPTAGDLALRRPSKSVDSIPVISDTNLARPLAPTIDVSGVMGDEREDVGRKKEGVLWGAGTWEEVGKGGKVKWEKYWVVLDHSSIYEYRDTDFDRPEGPHAVIDLKFASVREGRGTERRFVFEIVTPTQGRRLYQATSDSEMKQWIYSICNAIESVIQGTSSVRTFDTSKLRTISGAYDDHAVPLRQKLGFPIPGIPPRSGGLPSPMSSIPGSPSRRSMPPPSRADESGPGLFDQRPRKRQTSFKKALRQSAEIAGERWKDAMGPKYPLGDGRPAFLTPGNRIKSSSSHSAVSSWSTESPPPRPSSTVESHDGAARSSLGSTAQGSTSVLTKSPEDLSWNEEDPDGEIEKRVMEMAGLGLGFSPGRKEGDGRRVKSEGRGVLSGAVTSGNSTLGGDMTRSRSAEAVPAGPAQKEVKSDQRLDMETLRRVAGLPGNTVCADCGKSTKSSRWATISLRDTPMVMFICIRCCGIHRSFGTHISKPRSVDLDIWTQESIALAIEWGNEKGNSIWEAMLDTRDRARNDEDIPDFVRQKYFDGRWLSDEMRARYGLGPR